MKTIMFFIVLLLYPLKMPQGEEPRDSIWQQHIYDETWDNPEWLREQYLILEGKLFHCPKVFQIVVIRWEVDTVLYPGYTEWLQIGNTLIKVHGAFRLDSTAILDTVLVRDTTVYVGE